MTTDAANEAEYVEATLERGLLAAGQELSTALWKFHDTAQACFSSPDCVLWPDEEMAMFIGIAPHLDGILAEWRKAIALAEANARVALRSKDGREWKDPLDPRGILYFASLAGPDDLGYRTRLRLAREKEEARQDKIEEDLSHECGRPTLSGKPCRKLPAYWPGAGRKSGCTMHLKDTEKDELSSIWDRVVRTFDCPGCTSKAGQECSEENMVPIDGFFATPKSFSGRTVHSPRLDLFTAD